MIAMANTNQQAKKQIAAAKKTKRIIRRAATAVIVIGIIAAVITAFVMFAPESPGYAVASAGQGHEPTCSPQFNTAPATSGCHNPTPAPYEIYTETVDERRLVHSLEHGGIAIQYRETGILGESDQMIDDLTVLVNNLKSQDAKYCKIILAPYDRPFQAPSIEDLKDSARDKRIALTAWTHIDLLDTVDEERIVAFIDAFINKGPERLNDCRL